MKFYNSQKSVERLNLSDKFWQQCKILNENHRKQMGLCKIENIDNVNICTIAINPKGYFEKLWNRLINKKHEGVKRDTPGMKFESYTERIKV